MQDRIFYSICFGFTLGVLMRSFMAINLFFVLLIALLATALVLYFSLLKNFSSLKYRWMIIFSVFIFCFSFGILRLSWAEFATFYDYEPGQKIESEGKIIDDPDIRETNQRLTIEENISGIITKILVSTELGQDFEYGDLVRFSGEIEKPENFLTDQGKEFDYVNYLRKDGIPYVINFGQVEVVSSGHGNFIKFILFKSKHAFLDKIKWSIREPESTLMGGLVLGERSSFSQDFRDKLINTGTVHIVALSGFNVTIVADWIMKIFSFLPRNLGFGAGILGVILFVVMAGGQSTAIRAGVMAILVLIARATGRTYDVARALVVAGVAMILFNPMVLVYDVSFQLSFIATVVIIFFSPKVEERLHFITPRLGLRSIIAGTIAAYIFVLPFILYKMGNLSLVALPANILILPFIIPTMILGFLTGFAGFLHYLLAVPLGFISYLFLHYEISMISFFSNFPYASLTIPNFPPWITVLIYAYFIYRLFWRVIKEFFEFP